MVGVVICACASEFSWRWCDLTMLGLLSLGLGEPGNKNVSSRGQMAPIVVPILGGQIRINIDDADKRRPTRAPLRIHRLIFGPYIFIEH